MLRPPFFRSVTVACALVLLVACDNADERAEKHFQNGLELLAAGDAQRAILEFRNVVALQEGNLDARMAYAKAARSIGNIPESYSNYLRVVEQSPNNHEARLALVQMAIAAQNWEEADRHGAALIAANVDLDGTESAKLALDFRQAIISEDEPRIRELTRAAEALFESRKSDLILQRILIEGYSREGDFGKALEVSDIALATFPENQRLYLVKAELLDRLGDREGLEAHLRETIKQFPNDEQSKAVLIRTLTSRGQIDDAEEFMRGEIATAEVPQNAHINLISLLRQTRGNEVALAELDSAIGLYEDNQLLRALRAGILFDMGDPDGAVSEMQTVVEGSEPGENTDRYRVTLARMLIASGNEVGARQLVEEVLASDPGQVDALKMSARWSIDADKPEEALQILRLALDREPEDAEAMTLMAEAHQRNGNPELAQDLLALAVEASGNAPEESLRFARLLADRERFRPAEDVVIRALRTSPGHPELLVLLGRIHLLTSDWARAEQVEATLRRQGTPETDALADDLKLQIISRREGTESGVAFLESLSQEEDGNASARIALIRARIAEGRNDEALAMARELVDEFPDNPRARLLLSNTYFAIGNFAEAEQIIRETLTTVKDPAISLQLMRVLGAQGRMDEARETLDEALSVSPEDEDLLWVQASLLEQSKDIDGAVAIYEKLYARDTSSLIVANNLASLLATYFEDDESLERAFTVARRLNGTQVAPFQDTYGWILHRRGEHAEALSYLEPAAQALDQDPIVQYHLAKIYQALGREADAREAFGRAVTLSDEDDTRRQITEAREVLAAPAEESTDP